MIRLTFIDHLGGRHDVTAESGQSLMQAARRGGVRGILAECGGARACGTCHCYIDQAWWEAAGTPGEDEEMLLGFSEHVLPGSRLSCQVLVSDAMDGMEVRLPPSQP